ncbi:MAG: aldo/keto reductase, partial [Actinopolymorphaceae bacterium]
YRTAWEELAAETQRVDAGLMIIKTVSRRNWTEEDHRYTTWYEPFDEQEKVSAALAWVLKHPQVTGIATPGEVSLLGLLVEAERDRANWTDERMAEVLDGVVAYASPFVAMPI